MDSYLLCSQCFTDQGLRLDAERLGIEDSSSCPNCHAQDGKKLNRKTIELLAHRFFVWGTLVKSDFGAAPLIQFNQRKTTSIDVSSLLEKDVRLIGEAAGIGFFYYGPRLWMIGEIEPLKTLQAKETRHSILRRLVSDYPTTYLNAPQQFYRLRKAPSNPEDQFEYDSPPDDLCGAGRLDTTHFPVLYCSTDIQTCIHECRTTAEDEIYIATLVPKRSLKLLNLSDFPVEEDVTEFESLNIAMLMLFLAEKHSYEISRDIAQFVSDKGFDGIIYPSYFSLLRTGKMPFETAYGLSFRMIPELRDYERSKIIKNIAIFGRPVSHGLVEVRCINKLILTKVDYEYHFGPVGL